MPGAVPEGKRSIWRLGTIEVNDGGSDGLASTAGNTLFRSRGYSSRIGGSRAARRCGHFATHTVAK